MTTASKFRSAAAGLAAMSLAACDVLVGAPQSFENHQIVEPGQDACIQRQIYRARALQERITGEPSSIDTAIEAKSYAMRVSSLSTSALVFIPGVNRPSASDVQEANSINRALWISENRHAGFPGIATDTHIICNG